MRILHVCSAVAPRYGGPSIAVGAICAALARRGHDVELMTTDADGREALDVPIGAPMSSNGYTTTYFHALGTSYKPAPGLAAALWRRLDRFDVVHVHSLYQFSTAVACSLARRRRIPYVIRPHGTLSFYQRSRHPFRKTLYELAIERRDLNGAAAVHYTTRAEQREAQAFGVRAPGFVVPHGVDVPTGSRACTEHANGRGRQRIVFLGRLAAKKGIDVLVEAFASIATTRPDVELVIAGPDDEGIGTAAVEKARRLGIQDRLSLRGPVDGDEKWSLLESATAFVLPSADENFALAAVEAMAVGTPVIVSPQVALHDLIVEAEAGLVVPRDADSVRSAIEAILDDGSYAAELGANGRSLAAERFTWDAAAEDLEEVYSSIVGGRLQTVGSDGSSGRAPVTVVVLTYNEEQNLPACLSSVAGWADQILVVDSGSVDRTVEIARSFGAQVFEHAYVDHSSQWRWALESLPLANDWLLLLDADNAATDEFKRAASAALEAGPDADAYFARHIQYFRGKRIHVHKQQQLRLVRRSCVRPDGSELVDFRFVVEGSVGTIDGAVIESNRKEDSLEFWKAKQRVFAERLAAEEVLRRRGSLRWSVTPRLLGTPDERTVWLKQRWYRMPLFVRPFLFFGYRYVWRGGFLDGWNGLVFHALHSVWFRLLVDRRIADLQRRLRTGALTIDELESSSRSARAANA